MLTIRIEIPVDDAYEIKNALNEKIEALKDVIEKVQNDKRSNRQTKEHHIEKLTDRILLLASVKTDILVELKKYDRPQEEN